MQRIFRVGLHPLPGRAQQPRGCRDDALDVRRLQGPDQSEPRRPSLVGHPDRPGQRPQPADHLFMRGRQPRPQHLTGLHVQPTPDDRTGVNIQSDTRTLTDHWGLPRLWLYRQAPPLSGNPRSFVVGPQPPYRLAGGRRPPSCTPCWTPPAATATPCGRTGPVGRRDPAHPSLSPSTPARPGHHQPRTTPREIALEPTGPPTTDAAMNDVPRHLLTVSRDIAVVSEGRHATCAHGSRWSA